MQLWRRYLRISIVWKLAVALALGVVAGLIFGPAIGFVEPVGDLFLRLLSMLVVPLILFTLVVGVSSISAGYLGRIGGKVLAYYLFTATVAITLGIVAALLVSPGEGISLPAEEGEGEAAPSLGEVLLNIVPENPFAALAEGNVLAVVFLAIIVGIALSFMRESGEERLRDLAGSILRLFEGGAEIMFILVRGVLEVAPLGAFALIAVTIGETGAAALVPLALLTGVVYGVIALMIVFYVLLLLFFKVDVRRFFSTAAPPMMTAFVTRSSNGTLPVSMRAAEQGGVREPLYGFSLPLGATINMDGTAVYIGAAVVFTANVVGADLTLGTLVGVVLVGVLASVGTAGVPSAGLVLLTLALNQAGLPLAAVALVAGIDAVLDMARTLCNVTGDLVGTRVVAATEPEMRETPEEMRAPEEPAPA
ncbi:MAG: dicarboxylate/amino acid:cation symporter [Rubrobacter sp.]|nr:dicarboxylate/amino acid:cation symporter [Rubrobacter sp.]